MPQLLPAPWFFLMVVSWALFLALAYQKLIFFHAPQAPQPTQTQKTNTSPQIWTWQLTSLINS